MGWTELQPPPPSTQGTGGLEWLIKGKLAHSTRQPLPQLKESLATAQDPLQAAPSPASAAVPQKPAEQRTVYLLQMEGSGHRHILEPMRMATTSLWIVENPNPARWPRHRPRHREGCGLLLGGGWR